MYIDKRRRKQLLLYEVLQFVCFLSNGCVLCSFNWAALLASLTPFDIIIQIITQDPLQVTAAKSKEKQVKQMKNRVWPFSSWQVIVSCFHCVNFAKPTQL